MRENKVIRFLKTTSTRVVAFVTACIILAVCGWIFLYNYFGVNDVQTRLNSAYVNSYEYGAEESSLFTDLWLVGNIYLSRLDEKGNFTGSDFLKASAENALKDLNLMDGKGKITIGKYNNFKWYVAWNGKNEYFNDGNFDEIYLPEYSFIQKRGEMRNGSIAKYYYYRGNGYGEYYTYTTNYGMTYYYANAGERRNAVAVFDFDTSGLEWYIDSKGAKIYYKTDGTTPVPYSDDAYYLENSVDEEVLYEAEITEEKEELPKFSEIPDSVKKSDSMYIFNPENKSWTKIKSSQEQYSNEYPLTICITPKEELITEYVQLKSIADSKRSDMDIIFLKLIPFLVLSGVLMLYALATGGYSITEKKFTTSSTENIYAEFITVGIFLFLVADIMMINLSDNIYDDIAGMSGSALVASAVLSILLTVSVAIIFFLFNSLIKRIKCHVFWDTTLIKKVLVWIVEKTNSFKKKVKKRRFEVEEIKNNRFAKRFLLKLGILILFVTLAAASESALWLCITIIAYGLSSIKDIQDITNLSGHISRMNKGDYTKENIAENSVAYIMNENLNNISDGLQTAVEKRLQSERMKIDLVTNVSHDLKTPLTSIISYINLLSQEELGDVAKDYVKILENKSARLSEIVADVFDIAKATSRTDIQLEMIDAVVLMEQVYADMSDRIEKSEREVRKSVSADSAPIFADGKKLYRVLQNIIDNAIKYSLENTRVYISLEKNEESVVISVKNISSYEIKFTAEEITERFTRGDESRTSDGNGLGLSIAKSFTEACGGKLEITINGDLFVADVILPLTEKTTA